MRSFPIVLALAAGITLAGMATSQQPPQTGMPTIMIKSPEENANVTGPTVTLTVEVKNFTLAAQPSTPPKANEGYYAVMLNQKMVGQSTNTTFTLSNATAGQHTIMVQLMTHAGTPITTPGASDTVTITVKDAGNVTGPPEVNPPTEAPGFTGPVVVAGLLVAAFVLAGRRQR